MRNKCEELDNVIKNALAALEAEMERLWPRGKEVAFNIRRGQRNPSLGEVLWVQPPFVGISLFSKTGQIKRIHYSKILN